ncbi:GNAT family N-acetyltransferase [Halobacillus litoralis]|uniref:RimJ/RimL family protein N-acetyltransferase n=1 Tax=Halobacillus litoralis TaxID=45668 RepID=A0A410MB32_9BACI|nr:GNAT family protein [Halobacillus litoralis]QAS51972.1 RimJ/RimL family protein N-acetyltransferase [Halobacillus litoralis]
MFVHKVDEDLSLKLIDYQDAEELYNLSDRSRDHLRTWLPWINFTHSPDDTKKFIQASLQRYADNDGLTVCILYHGKIAGVVDFLEFDWGNKKTSVGYWMGADYKGKGLLTRSCRTLFDYAFQDMGLNRIEIRAAEENIKSRGIPERLGFVQEGVVRQAALLYDEYTDHVVYGMLAEEWNSNR